MACMIVTNKTHQSIKVLHNSEILIFPAGKTIHLCVHTLTSVGAGIVEEQLRPYHTSITYTQGKGAHYGTIAESKFQKAEPVVADDGLVQSVSDFSELDTISVKAGDGLVMNTEPVVMPETIPTPPIKVGSSTEQLMSISEPQEEKSIEASPHDPEKISLWKPVEKPKEEVKPVSKKKTRKKKASNK